MDKVPTNKGAISVSSEVIKLKERKRRNSTGTTIPLGSLTLSNSDGKLLPRYLSPSIASCHDFCKHGRKNPSEDKGKRPFLPSSMDNKVPRNEEPKMHIDKPKVVRQNNPTPAMEVDTLREPDTIKKHITSHDERSFESVKPNTLKQKVPSSIKKSIPSFRPQVCKHKASSPLDRTSLSAKNAVTLKRKTTLPKPLPVLKHLQIIRPRNQEDHAMKNFSVSKVAEKKVSKQRAACLSSKFSGNDFSRMKLRKHRNANPAYPVNNQETVAEAENDRDDTKEKTSCITELKKDNQELDHVHQTSENTLSSPSNYKEDEVKESDSATSNTSEPDSEEESVENKVEFAEGEEKMRCRRTVGVHLEEKFSTPQKLRFRRGKVIDLQLETNGPRKLRFSRRGRMVSEVPNDNSEVGRRNFKSGEFGGSLSSNVGSEAQTVVLKHQEVQGGRDSQGLFNHVIEQTATKLVETRKSKVKALVGAFETVISLQESKLATAL